MKKTIGTALLIAVFFTVYSCAKPEMQKAFEGFSIDKTNISATEHGVTETLKVTANTFWTAEVPDNCSWIKITPSMGDGSAECQIEIDQSVKSDSREATVIFTSNRETKKLQVSQLGYAKAIILDSPSVDIEASAAKRYRYFVREITTNVTAFTLICKDEEGQVIHWINSDKNVIEPKLEYGARPGKVKVRINWNINTDPEKRTAKIEFKPLHADEQLETPAILTVTQKAAPLIEDNAKGDSLALLTIQERLNGQRQWDGSSSIKTWKNVILWEDGDSLPSPDALGRVRAFKIQSIMTDETVPEEIKHLKYVEQIIIMSNGNAHRKRIALGPEICTLKHLKYLTLGSYGISSLPDNFKDLGESLVYLSLWGNYLEEIPDCLNPVVFKKLEALDLAILGASYLLDLRELGSGRWEDGAGLYIDTRKPDNVFKRLLLWGDKLEYLNLSNNLIEGSIPDFKIGEEVVINPLTGEKVEVRAYSKDDPEIKEMGDTLSFLLTPEGQKIPRILPNARRASCNLSFLTGNVPDWVLYHPFLIRLDPDALIFNQRGGVNSAGKQVGFDNVPANLDYYFDTYPLYRGKYLIPDDQL